jgi:fructokinase
MSKIVCFGEVLWDVFPNDTKKIGGAPLNVALRLHDFGHDVAMISAIGCDPLGQALVAHCTNKGLSAQYIQTHKTYTTGTVQVNLDASGTATYSIEYPSAWDFITVSEALITVVDNARAFIFGSLITRNSVSKATLFKLLDVANYKVFDLNLRPPHYSKAVLLQLINRADFIKCNDEELQVICEYLESTVQDLEGQIKHIAALTHTSHICVTRGALGAVLWYEEQFYYGETYSVTVVDTVGAGDAFLGSLISQLLKAVAPQDAISFASAVGALVASREGATPHLELDEIKNFMKSR